MRIGIVTATYLPSRNGVATSTALFARGLRSLGHEVRLFAPEHPQREGEDEPGVVRLPSTMLAAPMDYPLLLPPSAAALARQRVADLDVIHTMHPFLAGQIALRWARTLDVPLFFTAHTQYHQYLHYAPRPRHLGGWLMRRHVRAFARAADVVLAPGRAIEESLRRYGYKGEVVTLPNPVDLAAFRGIGGGQVRERHGVAENAPLLLYVGRLAAEKNLEVLLEAFKLVLARLPAARLLLVGDGPARVTLRARAEGLPVVFAGAVPHAEVPAYLRAADLFVTASTSEVLPMSMIEALAAGTPLVAARSPAGAELIRPGVNGMLCDATPVALAGAVLDTLTSGELAALRAGALASAGAYDVTALARDLAALYAQACEVRSPRRLTWQVA